MNVPVHDTLHRTAIAVLAIAHTLSVCVVFKRLLLNWKTGEFRSIFQVLCILDLQQYTERY